MSRSSVSASIAARPAATDAAPGTSSHPLARPLDDETRRRRDGIFLRYLEERDGALEWPSRKLARREARLASLEASPVRSHKRIDLARFHANHEADRIEEGLEPLMLFLLLVAKINRVERYGVEVAVAAGSEARGAIDAYILAEEDYHTRLMHALLGSFGIEIEMRNPSAASRALVHLIVRLPKSWTMPIFVCSELAALMIFDLLIERAEQLLADEPAVRDRVVELLREILTDEMAHVGYARAHLGRTGAFAARTLLPLVARGIFGDLGEVSRLFDPQRIGRGIREYDRERLSARCLCTPLALAL